MPTSGQAGRMMRAIKLTMRDGVRLATDVYLPEAEGVFPAVLVRTAYDRTRATMLREVDKSWETEPPLDDEAFQRIFAGGGSVGGLASRAKGGYGAGASMTRRPPGTVPSSD